MFVVGKKVAEANNHNYEVVRTAQAYTLSELSLLSRADNR